MRFTVFFAAGAVLLGLASAMPAPQNDEDKPMPVSESLIRLFGEARRGDH